MVPIAERQERILALLLEEQSVTVGELSDRFNVSMRTAHDDYSRAMKLLREEQLGTREELLNQIQALRLATVHKALRKGQMQTVAMLLKDMGSVIGEAAPETLAINVPNLQIKIEE